MHQTHREAAEQHKRPAHGHRTAAEHKEKGATGPARSKSGKMETVDVDTL